MSAGARRRLAAGLAVAGLACGATPAPAQSGRLAEFDLGLTSRSPGSPSGLTLRVLFRRAEDPSAKPPPLRSAVLEGPAGLRFDTGAIAECTASDEQLRTRGPDACPVDTRLTIGSFSAISGFGPPLDPLEADDHVFNGPSQLIEVITFHGSSASPAFDRLRISGSTLTANPPSAPGGPPDGEMAIRSIDVRIPPRVTGARSLITTPPACPAGGQWTSTARFAFGDGSVDTVVSRTPCDRAATPARPQPPRLRVLVTPRRVRTGRWVRLRFRVTSAAAACRAGARVRVGRRRLATDRRGAATLRIRFRRAGIRGVVATRPGCRPGRARVDVI